MATFTYNQIKIAVDRAEQAANTYINVASIQQDFTPAEFEDIKTLKRRIDDHLDIAIEDFRGEDGISVVSIIMDDTSKDITVSYSDGSSQTFTDLFIPSIIGYRIENNNLIETTEPATDDNKGRIVGEPGNLIINASIDDGGDITFTTDNNAYTVGNVNNFGENPITAVQQIDGNLYLELNGDWLPDPVGRVKGPEGDAGVLPVEQTDTDVMVTWDGTKATLTINRTEGAPIVLDNVPFDQRVATPEDALQLDVVNNENIFTLATGQRINLGEFDGEDGGDGANRVPDFNQARQLYVYRPPSYIVAGVFSWESDFTYQRLVFKNNNWDTSGSGYPTLRIISPYTTRTTPPPSGGYVEPLISLRGEYVDVVADDVTISDSGINGNGQAFVELTFSDDTGNPTTQTIIIGDALGDDGESITDINITTDGDIVVSYLKGSDEVIGNIQYDVITDAAIDPITNTIELIFLSGDTLTTKSTDVSGADGVSRSINRIIIDMANEGMLSFEMNKGDDILDIGKLRPIRDHNINVTTEGELQIRLDGETEFTEHGNIRGTDASRNITDVLFDGTLFQLQVNNTELEAVGGAIEHMDGIEYDHANGIIQFNRGTRSFDFPYERGIDGEHFNSIITWDVVDTLNNRELTISMTDGSSPVSGLEIDSVWLQDMYIDDNEDLNIAYGRTWDTLLTVHPESAAGYNATDGSIPSTIQIEGLDLWVRDWNDGTPDENLGQVIAKWLEEVIIDDTTGEVKYRYNTDTTFTPTGYVIDGEDARYITDLQINSNRQLEVTYNNADVDVLDQIDGVDAVYITNITRDGDEFTVTFNNGDIKTATLESFDGILPRWITSFTINTNREFEAVFAGTDYDLVEYTDTSPTVIGNSDGEDARYITHIERDGDNFTAHWADGTTDVLSSISGFDGIDGELITDIFINASRELVVSWHGGGDVVITPNVDFDREVMGISINTDGKIEILYSNGDSTVTDTVVRRRVTDAFIDDTTELGYIETNYAGDIEVGYTAGEDFADGRYITNIFYDNDKLYVDLTDGTTLEVGDFLRREIVDYVLEGEQTNEFVVKYSDGTEDNLGNVRGETSTLNMVDAFINQNYELVITLDDPTNPEALDPIIIPNVRGDDGNGIVSSNIVNGELVFTMDDATEINVGNVEIDFGFAPYNPQTEYQETQSMTLDGKIYVAQREGVDKPPSEAPEDWTTIRLEGDPTPDAGRPEPISPINEEVYPNKQPFLEGGGFRNYFSPDILKERQFQIDTIDGNFSTPVYSANENALGHQVEDVLNTSTEYKWRIRDIVDIDGVREYTTAWSVAGTFTVSDETIFRPSVFAAAGLNPNAMIAQAGFEATDFFGSGTHTASSWQVVRESDGVVVYEDIEGTDLRDKVLPWDTLRADTTYRVRVRHHSGSNMSAWSAWFPFATRVRFESIQIKPVISFVDEGIGDSITSTVAKPRFKSNSNIGEFWDDYMGREGLLAVWEVRDSSDALVWDSVSAIDIESVRVAEVLDSGVGYKVRVRYESNQFIGPSEWSDYLAFTPSWSIDTPVVSYAGNVNEADIDSTFDSSAFVGVNDSFRFLKWEITDSITGDVVYSGNSITSSWDVEFSVDDSEKEYAVRIKHLGLYGESDWSEPLSIVVQKIVDIFVYSAGFGDSSVRKFNEDGLQEWNFTGHTNPQVRSVAVDVDGNVYSSSTDQTVRKIDPDGNQLWVYTGHTDIVYDIALDNEANTYSVSFDGYLRSTTSDGVERFSIRKVSGGALYSVHIDNINNVGTIGLYSGVVGTFNLSDGSVFAPGTLVSSNLIISLASDLDGNFYASSSDNKVTKFNPLNNSITWSGTFPSALGKISYGDGRIAAPCQDKLRVLSDVDGSVIWEVENTGGFYSSAIDVDGNIYAGDRNGYIYKFDETGTEIWNAQTTNGISIYELATTTIPFLLPHVDLSVEFEELEAPTPLNALTFSQVESLMTAPTVQEVTASVILDKSKPTNIEGTYDDSL